MTPEAPNSWMKSSRLNQSYAHEWRSLQNLVDRGWAVVRDLVSSLENLIKSHKHHHHLSGTRVPMVSFHGPGVYSRSASASFRTPSFVGYLLTHCAFLRP